MTYKQPNGEVDQNNINTLSGSITAPFLDAIMLVSDDNLEAVQRLNNLLTAMYSEGRESDMIEIIKIIYDATGRIIPHDLETVNQDPPARSYFLLCFLDDLDDWLIDYN